MQNTTCRILAVAAGILTVLAPPAMAAGLEVPCWRGQAGTTLQDWQFDTGSDPASPEQVSSPGTPVADIHPGLLSSGWLSVIPDLGARSGIWDLGGGGQIEFAIPETAGSPVGYRYVLVQTIGYIDAFIYTALPSIDVPGATLVDSTEGPVIETTPFGGQWIAKKAVYRLPAAPGSEVVRVQAGAFGALVDQVLVETLTIDYPCPADITDVADPGQCNKAHVTWSLPAQDGCVFPSVVSTRQSGDTFPVGTTAVTAQVTDAYGYTRTCNWTVTINDTQLPAVVCPANIIAYKETAGSCGVIVNFTPTADDNCPGVTIQSTPPSGSEFPLGFTTVTCVAQDASGNLSSPCSFTVQVVDVSGDIGAAPCWRGTPMSTYQQWAFSAGTDPASPELWTNAVGTGSANVALGGLASGWLDGGSLFGCRQGVWDLGANGSIELSVPDVTGTVNGYRYVVVQATGYEDLLAYELPTVSLAGATLVSSNWTTLEAALLGYWQVEKTVWRLPAAPGSQVVRVQAGAFGALVDQVLVETLTIDYPCPADITDVADPGQCNKAGVAWTLPSVDGCVIVGVENEASASPIPNPNTFPVGITEVTSTVTDVYGHTKVCTFSVEIEDTQAPAVTCPPNIVVLKQASLCGAVVTFNPSASDNCPGVTIQSAPASGTEFPLGFTMVTCVAQDASGNLSAPCTFTVQVLDASGDLGAPPCWRGSPTSTYQQWAFSTVANPAAPELLTNVMGAAEATITVGPFGSGWLYNEPLLGCRQGLWDLGSGGVVSLVVPDATRSAPAYRYVVVQVTAYEDSFTYTLPTVSVPAGTAWGTATETVVETGPFGQWVVQRSVWRLPNCPAAQTVQLTAGAFGSMVDQVLIETVDLEYPMIANVSDVSDPTMCGKANVTWVYPPLDGCRFTNIIFSPALGSTFPVGTTPVTAQIKDAFGYIIPRNFDVTISDVTPPAIADVSVTQTAPSTGTRVVKNCANPTYQGTIDIIVRASDLCGLAGPPVVTFTQGPVSITATYVNMTPPGYYNFTWTVGPTTPGGTWTGTVTVTDTAGLTTTTTFTLCVDTSAITGQVALEGFVGTSRAVTFVAKGGAATKTWTIPLVFSGGTASYSLLGVPSGTTTLSAKTTWSLRRRLPVALDANGQAVANFTGSSNLMGGDITGDNLVSIPDYNLMWVNWQSSAAVADITGDTSVSLPDYFLLQLHWQASGDPE